MHSIGHLASFFSLEENEILVGREISFRFYAIVSVQVFETVFYKNIVIPA